MEIVENGTKIEDKNVSEKHEINGELPKTSIKYVPAFSHKPLRPLIKPRKNKEDSSSPPNPYLDFKIYSLSNSSSTERLKQKIQESQTRQTIKINWSALE